MPRRRYVPCPEPGCPELRDLELGDCPRGHWAAARKRQQQRTDAQRPNARQRGYDKAHERSFRIPVLRRDPVCVIPGCTQPSRHADHYPLTRTQLVQRGMNPNDPAHGRGLCASHHAAHTAAHDGGFGNPMHSHAAEPGGVGYPH